MSNITPFRGPAEPPVIIEDTLLAALEDLAAAAGARMPDLAGRLLHELSRARIVPDGEAPADVVAIGSLVTFRDESTGRVQQVSLVLPAHADIEYGRVSVLTPIGVALIGLAQGASIRWETRSGETRRLTVLEVANPALGAPPPAAA